MIARAARRIAAGALLGLPAALLAHVLVFGGEHTVGGAMHRLLVDLAFVAGFCATLVVAIRARRLLHGFVPRMPAVLAGSAAWFAAIELCERGHDVPVLVAALALLLSSAIVRAVLRAFAHTLVAIVTALWTPVAAAAAVCARALVGETPAPQVPADRFRLFSRPPPALS